MLTYEEFMRQRPPGIGASEIAAVFELDPYQTALELYLGKIGDLAPRPGNKYTRRGQMFEDLVALTYEEDAGVTLERPEQPTSTHPLYPWLFASPDRLGHDAEGRRYLVEIKTAGGFSDDRWGEPGTDEIPLHYLLQVQQQMMVLDLERADVACLFSLDDFRVYTVQRNATLAEQILAQGQAFWDRVQNRDPPPPNWGHRSTLALYRSMYGVNDQIKVDLPAEADFWVSQYAMLGQQISKSKQDRDEAKARLLEMMGAGAVATTPGGRQMTRKVVRRTGYTVKPTEFTQFHLIKEK